jgi:NAD-dependent deacetylase
MHSLHDLAAVAARSRRVMVSTGAGVSRESGVPTFRDGDDSVWGKHDPVMLASVEGFRKDPAFVWQWYDERRQQALTVQPNPGHYALAEWEALWRQRGWHFNLATQNIDDLHRRAGSTDVIELHGNLWEVRPLDSPHRDAFRLDEAPLPEIPPRDAEGQLLRPNVVWFGEALDELTLERAIGLAQQCDLFLLVGTSSVVYPAALLPVSALRAGAVVAEINPNPTELTDHVHFAIPQPSGEALPMLLELVRAALAGG